MEILRNVSRHLGRKAVVHEGKVYTYEALLKAAEKLHFKITDRTEGGLGMTGRGAVDPPRVGLYAAPGPEYVAGTLAIWQAGCIAVPLAVSHPPPELDYVLQDAGLSMVLTHANQHSIDKLGNVTSPRGVHLGIIEEPLPCAHTEGGLSNSIQEPLEPLSPELLSQHDQGALIIYTSGTTGRPKGALHTHRSLSAQVSGLVEAWRWQQDDVITHALPLHHIHGIVNALYCPLSVGAQVDILSKFSPSTVWNRIMEGRTSVFMGVPTMYAMLLASYDAMPPEQQAKAAAAAARLRLAVSGSSACPVPIMERWKTITGSYLLERYGMTEVGMALSNPYQPLEARKPGTVGQPLPGMDAKVLDTGELLVRGGNLFSKYWGRPEATEEAFDEEGFFLTGDTASTTTDPDTGKVYFSILGRSSVDIIKSGGYKISALQIEGVLLEHPDLAEVAVLGVDDEVYGEVVTALVVPRHKKPVQAPSQQQPHAQQPSSNGSAPGLAHGHGLTPGPGLPASTQDAQAQGLITALKQHCRERLAAYQAPRRYMVIDALPRNAMGKINKKQLKAMFESAPALAAEMAVQREP